MCYAAKCESYRDAFRKYYARNSDKKEAAKLMYSDHPEMFREASKKAYADHPEKSISSTLSFLTNVFISFVSLE